MCRESAEFRKQAEMHLLVAKPQLKRKIEVVDLSSDAEDGDDDEEVEEEGESEKMTVEQSVTMATTQRKLGRPIRPYPDTKYAILVKRHST